MAVKRFSNSLISQSGQDKVTNFIAGYSPAVDEMDLIERVTVGAGGAASITFSNIPQTYQHLQLRIIGRSSATRSSDLQAGYYANLQINSDSGSNYAVHSLFGDGGSATANGATSQPNAYINRFASASNSASVFGASIVDILDYASIGKNKTLRLLGGLDGNGGGRVYLTSNLWISTNAITSLTLTAETGNWVQHTVASLYGVIA